jgi:hypothetical protein
VRYINARNDARMGIETTNKVKEVRTGLSPVEFNGFGCSDNASCSICVASGRRVRLVWSVVDRRETKTEPIDPGRPIECGESSSAG